MFAAQVRKLRLLLNTPQPGAENDVQEKEMLDTFLDEYAGFLEVNNMFEEHIGRLALLHSARQRVAENKARRKELMDTFFAEHAEFFEGMDVADDVLNRITEEVRQEAVVLYKTIPNLDKTAIPGITIRESTVVGYDPSTALEWAIKHQLALQLDERVYKQWVLWGQAPGSVDVTLTVAIAGDLSKFTV